MIEDLGRASKASGASADGNTEDFEKLLEAMTRGHTRQKKRDN